MPAGRRHPSRHPSRCCHCCCCPRPRHLHLRCRCWRGPGCRVRAGPTAATHPPPRPPPMPGPPLPPRRRTRNPARSERLPARRDRLPACRDRLLVRRDRLPARRGRLPARRDRSRRYPHLQQRVRMRQHPPPRQHPPLRRYTRILLPQRRLSVRGQCWKRNMSHVVISPSSLQREQMMVPVAPAMQSNQRCRKAQQVGHRTHLPRGLGGMTPPHGGCTGSGNSSSRRTTAA